MVYVDELRPRSPRLSRFYNGSCFMFADSEEELHQLAGQLGLPKAMRRYFHRCFLHRSEELLLPHYELNERQRALAVLLEAVDLLREDILVRLAPNPFGPSP